KHGLGLPSVDCLASTAWRARPCSCRRSPATAEPRPTRGASSRSREDWGPPDLAAEIALTERVGLDVRQKCPRSFDLGVPVVVLIDVEEELILVMRPDRQQVVIRGDARIDLDDVLPGFDLTVCHVD